MILLLVGLTAWIAGHFFKRFMPEVRAGMGNAGRGVSAAVILAGIVLMVIGYRAAEVYVLYDTPGWARHVNNVLMYVAVVLFGLGSSKSSWRSSMRHPMLTGVIVWGIAHLLVNGDLASLVLFGTLIIWALAEMRVINASEPTYHRFEGGSLGGTVRLLVIAAVVYAVIAAIHTWLGYWPFPG